VPVIGAACWFECTHMLKPTGCPTHSSAINHTLTNLRLFYCMLEIIQRLNDYSPVHSLMMMMMQWGPQRVEVDVLKYCCNSNEVCAFAALLCNNWNGLYSHNFLVNNQLDALFSMCLFTSLLYMFLATQCSSSGESIVSIHHLVCITLCRWLSGMPTCIPVTYREWYIPDNVLIQLILLMMSTGLLETRREVK